MFSRVPRAQRAAGRDELADMIGGVIDREQDGTEIWLVVFAGWNSGGQIIDITGEPLQALE